MELFVFIIVCVLAGTTLAMSVMEWYERHKEQKTMFIKDEEWLRMDDKTQLPHTTNFAQARYVRPGSYIQDVSYFQPVYDNETGVIRMIDSSVEAGLPCSVSPITLSKELKENIKNKKRGC